MVNESVMGGKVDRGMVGRMLRASRLEDAVYEEVEHDLGATRQAVLVVVITSVAAGIGSLFSFGPAGLILFPIVSLIAWAIYAYLTYFIGTRIFAGPETSADWGELARTLAFANSPRILLIFAIGPILEALVGVIVGIWVLVATIVALRAALDFSTGRAIGTAILGWIAQVVVLGLLFSFL